MMMQDVNNDNLFIVTKLDVLSSTVDICANFHNELNAVKYMNEIPHKIAEQSAKKHSDVTVQQINPCRYEIYIKDAGWIYNYKCMAYVIELKTVKEELIIEKVE